MLNKKYLTCIPCEHRPFWQLNRLNDFTTETIANLFVHERLKIAEAYSESSGTSKMELFQKCLRLKAINYFCKKHLLRCSTGF